MIVDHSLEYFVTQLLEQLEHTSNIKRAIKLAWKDTVDGAEDEAAQREQDYIESRGAAGQD